MHTDKIHTHHIHGMETSPVFGLLSAKSTWNTQNISIHYIEGTTNLVCVHVTPDDSREAGGAAGDTVHMAILRELQVMVRGVTCVQLLIVAALHIQHTQPL